MGNIRVIKIENNIVTEVKSVLPNYVFENGEIQSDLGGIGQIQQEDGSFIVPPPPVPTLDQVKQAKKDELKKECYDLITAGFKSNVKYGEIHQYTLSDLDQANMLTLMQNISLGFTTVPWHYYGQVVCDAWSADDFKLLYQQATVFGTNYRLKSDIIEKYIDEQPTTVDEVNSINMNFTLPADYQTLFESKLAELNCPLWVETTT